MLSSPKSTWYDISTGYNIGLVTEGQKDWKDIIQDIAYMSRDDQIFRADKFHAVFVRTEDLPDLQKGLTMKGIPQVTLDTTLQEKADMDLAVHLYNKKETRSLLVVQIKSIERAIDCMLSSSKPIQQLAFFGKDAEKTAAFMNNWINVNVCSVGSIYPVALLGE